MSAVPRSLRDGAYALGCSKMQVAIKVVVPAAMSGIVAAFVLGMSRAIGETMIVAIAGGRPGGPDAGTRSRAADDDRVHRRRPARATCRWDRSTTRRSSRSASLLFIMTFALNLLSIRLVRKFREVYE